MKKTRKKCFGCGRRPVFSIHSKFCRTCGRVAFRMKERRFPPEAVEGVWKYIRQYDYRCEYTDLPLEMEDIRSPLFCVFDHVTPLDPNRIALVCAWVNELKSALAKKEFNNIIPQLADYEATGKKIRKIELGFWRQYACKINGPSPAPLAPMAKPKWLGKHKKCCLCGKPVFTLQSKYCLRCSHFAKRVEMQRFAPEVKQAIFDYVRKYGFVCYYTGLRLEMHDFNSPWYCVFNCLTPGDRSKVVLTCALFNEMKSDFSEEEFWYYIRQLANHIRYGTKIRMKKLKFWYRLTLRQLYLKSIKD
jgi:ribosomal protein L37E